MGEQLEASKRALGWLEEAQENKLKVVCDYVLNKLSRDMGDIAKVAGIEIESIYKNNNYYGGRARDLYLIAKTSEKVTVVIVTSSYSGCDCSIVASDESTVNLSEFDNTNLKNIKSSDEASKCIKSHILEILKRN